MNFETMSQQRKMILIAAAVGIISMFLPWVSVSHPLLGSVTANGMHNSGILVLIGFVGAGVLAFMGDQTQNLNRMNWMLALIAGALSLLITLINFFDIGSARGFGIYLSLAAAIAVVAFAYMHRSATDSLQGGFDSLKNNFSNTTQTGATASTNDTTKTIV